MEKKKKIEGNSYGLFSLTITDPTLVLSGKTSY
jgi:hypothetical protein